MDLFDLWLPIVAAALACHVLCTLAWTALPHHRPEWKHLAWGPIDEATRSAGVEPGGQYLLSTGEESDRDATKCRGMLILWDHTPHLGANIGLTLAFHFAVATTIGYLAAIGLDRTTPALDVFRFTATAGLLVHAFGGLQHLIWFRRRWVLEVVDGVVYALATGAAFALLWPK